MAAAAFPTPKRRPRQHLENCRALQTAEGLVQGPTDTAPDYRKIDAALLNRALMGLFQNKLELALGEESTLSGYSPTSLVQASWPTNCAMHRMA